MNVRHSVDDEGVGGPSRNDPYAASSPTHRLYRNPRRGMLLGVCAGIADYAGFDLRATRVLVVLGALFAFPVVSVSYVVLGLLLPRAPYGGPEGEVDPVRRRAVAQPHDMLSSVRYRFRDLDVRLQRLEKYVTSSRYRLDREFRQLQE